VSLAYRVMNFIELHEHFIRQLNYNFLSDFVFETFNFETVFHSFENVVENSVKAFNRHEKHFENLLRRIIDPWLSLHGQP
jgi:hypothetical protein